MWIVGDDHDQPAQIAVVPRHGDAAVGRGEQVSSDAARDVDAAMGTQSRIALSTQPIAKAGKQARSSASGGSKHTQKARKWQHHEKNGCNGIDDQGKDAEAPFSPIAPHEPNDRLLQHIRGQISNAPRLPHAPVKALDLI